MRTRTKHICRCIFLWSADIALGGAPGIKVGAQQTQQFPQTQQAPQQVQRQAVGTTDDRASFDQFLAQHKDIARDLQNKPWLVNDRDLQANPALANDNDYLNKHRDLRAFLDKDPDVRERVRSNPSSIVPAKTETTPTRTEPVPARTANPKGNSSDVKSDRADIKSDKADVKSDKAAKDKAQKPQKPVDKPKTPIEQREEIYSLRCTDDNAAGAE